MSPQSSRLHDVLLLLVGFVFGFQIVVLVKQGRCVWNVIGSYRPRTLAKELGSKELLVVGVMTADKFLATRGKAAFETWGQNVPGKLLFFASEGSQSAVNLPVVALPGVDDSYPPVKKSFMMLKYLHDHYIDRFEWFLRADDDVFIRGEKLAKFIYPLNSSEDFYIGHAGTGIKEEKHLLHLASDENYCLGGPGMLLSRSILKKVAPHLEYCFENVLSTHEDVEIGRCIHLFTGVGCTPSHEMRKIFYHNYTEKESVFHGNLDTKSIHDTITLHPVKNPEYLYRLHAHFMSLEIQELQDKAVKVQRVLNKIDQFLSSNLNWSRLSEKHLHHCEDISRNLNVNHSLAHGWDMLTTRSFFSRTKETVQGIAGAVKGEIQELKDTLDGVPSFRNCYRRLKHGYKMEHPVYGVQHFLHVQFTCARIHYGLDNRRKLAPVTRMRTARFQKPFAKLISQADPPATIDPIVHIIVPLQGRIETFRRFMRSFERVCLKQQERVKLLVAYFSSNSTPHEHKAVVKEYQTKYPTANIFWLEVSGSFSRGIGLTIGAQQFSKDALLFLCDVDLIFSSDFLDRCRTNTAQGQLAYFPIMFSLFNPNITYSDDNIPQTFYTINKEAGYWRKYSLGPACLYHNDLLSVGGFNLAIKGWGLEDLQLYESFIRYNGMSVFRSQDPGLIHVYHPVNCDPQLATVQYESCLKTKAGNFASQKSLLRALISRNLLNS